MAKTANNQQEFSKVYKAALVNKFQGASIENLLKVIYATPNPEIAMELVLNIYEEPVIEQTVIDTNGKKLTFISFNAFEREVIYSYQQNKSVHIYIDRNIQDITEITPENYQDYRKSWGDNTVSYNVIFPEIETVHSTMNLSSWNKLQVWQAPKPADIDYCLAC